MVNGGFGTIAYIDLSWSMSKPLFYVILKLLLDIINKQEMALQE